MKYHIQMGYKRGNDFADIKGPRNALCGQKIIYGHITYWHWDGWINQLAHDTSHVCAACRSQTLLEELSDLDI